MSTDLTLQIRRLPHAEGISLPEYQSPGAAGLDLSAALPEHEDKVLPPGGRALIATGLQIALPQGYEAQIRPRSGLAFKHGVTVLNSPGTIDADYRGEVKVLLINLGEDDFLIRRGERIAQMIIAPVSRANIAAVVELSETARGQGGFGSTGL
ncbi:MAG: dUTP diphosphatase [Methyloligella sp. ZOD6]